MKNATFKTRNMNLKLKNKVSYEMGIYESGALDLGIGMLRHAKNTRKLIDGNVKR